jgi:hypothetical protein
MTYKIKIREKIFETIETTIEKIPYLKDKFKNTDTYEIYNIDANKFGEILDCVRYGKDLPIDCDDLLLFLELIGKENKEEMIEINVGGIRKIYLKKNIMKIEYFKGLIDFKEQYVFLDMNIEIFDHIMDYVKGERSFILKKYLKEADFLGINYEDTSNETISKTYDETYYNINDSMCGAYNKYFDIYNEEKDKTIDGYNDWAKNSFKKCILSNREIMCESLSSLEFNNTYKIKISKNVEAFSYLIFELEIDCDILTDYDIEWIEDINSFIFRTVEIEIGGACVSRLNGEAIYLYNKIKNLKQKNNKFSKILTIPFLNFLVESHNMIIISRYHEMIFHFRFRELDKLIKVLHNNIDITNKVNTKDIIKGNIKNCKIHIIHNSFDSEKRNKFHREPSLYFIRKYYTYIEDIKDKKCEVMIYDPIMLDAFAFYIRDKNGLYPINLNSNIEFNFYVIMLDYKSYLIKSNSRIVQMIGNCTKNYSIDGLPHNGFVYDYNKEMDNIIYYNFATYGFGSIGTHKTNLHRVDKAALEINFEENFDTQNKEIVLVCFGCGCLAYHSGMIAVRF